MWGPQCVLLHMSHTSKDGNSALSGNQAYSLCLWEHKAYLLWVLLLFLQILHFKNKTGNAKVNLLSMSALLLALKTLSGNRTFEFPGLHVWICSLIALRHGRVWLRFSCFVLVLICFVQVKASGKAQLYRSSLFYSCFSNEQSLE